MAQRQTGGPRTRYRPGRSQDRGAGSDHTDCFSRRQRHKPYVLPIGLGFALNHLVDRTIHEVAQGAVFDLMPDETQERVRALSDEEIRAAVIRGITRPQPGETAQSARLLLNPCLTIQWLSA